MCEKIKQHYKIITSGKIEILIIKTSTWNFKRVRDMCVLLASATRFNFVTALFIIYDFITF